MFGFPQPAQEWQATFGPVERHGLDGFAQSNAQAPELSVRLPGPSYRASFHAGLSVRAGARKDGGLSIKRFAADLCNMAPADWNTDP